MAANCLVLSYQSTEKLNGENGTRSRLSVSTNDLNCESETVICRSQSLPFPLAEKETGNKSYNQSAEVGLPGDSWYDYSKPKTEGDTHPKWRRYEEI